MTSVYKLLFTFFIVLLFTKGFSQQPDYSIRISNSKVQVLSVHLQLGSNKDPHGNTLDANSLSFLKNGKPWLPVMGEFHFVRYPKKLWEDEILKMEACGIDIIASYVFWIYHEEEEGKWNWDDNRDLRYFVQLCQKHHVYFFARIGPWCHGEVRNGGFPDWLLKKSRVRKNDSVYFNYVQLFYKQINQQLQGLYFKNGGPVIGVQIENEFGFKNAAGLQHMLTLKKIAREQGIDAPFYTATGWPNSDQKQTELIPVWGAYPEAPWDKRTSKLPLSANYLFDTLRNDPLIGNDILHYDGHDLTKFAGYIYPYATAELGGGNQVTYHRRPIIQAKDVSSLAFTRTGSGANLLGYYMFHGGSNAVGNLSTLQESKATAYPNDYSIINYDFFALIGEWGELRPSYHQLKILHLFLNDFGDQLAQTNTFFPNDAADSAGDTKHLRWSVRSRNGSGFVFISNYQRQKEMHDIPGIQLKLVLDNKTLNIPSNAIIIKKDVQAIWPFHMFLDGMVLTYATAQPLCKLALQKPLYVFFQTEGVVPEYVFDESYVKTMKLVNCKAEKKDKQYKITADKPGTNCLISIQLTDGKTIQILTLTNEQGLHTWKTRLAGKERIFISKQDLMFEDDSFKMQSTGSGRFQFSVYPAFENIITNETKNLQKTADGIFTGCTATMPERKINLSLKKNDELNGIPLSKEMDSVSHLPLYGTNLERIPGASYWDLEIPANALKGLSDAFVQINYYGDTQAAYLNNKLIADDFYTGLPMTLSLKQFAPSIVGNKIVLLVTPLDKSKRIFFEDEVRKNVTTEPAASISNVSVVPQYEIAFRIIK
jgi:beta-galactosidase